MLAQRERAMDDTSITYDLTDGIATITLNRPEVMNALSASLRRSLLAALLRAQGEARVLVLTGAGRAFCSGQDLQDAGKIGSFDLERILNDEYVPMIKAITDSPIPTIAAVNGAAAGAGANLALAADIVIAAESASFIQAFTRIGLVPDAGGSYWLPRQIGMARAMGAMLLGDKISATQAADWGMIYETVPDAGFATHVRARAAQLAAGALAMILMRNWRLRRGCKGPAGRPRISAKESRRFWRNVRRGLPGPDYLRPALRVESRRLVSDVTTPSMLRMR
ncbi:MAG: 1,2-epoxyphenylacetyl-CoA isomerase [Pseudomonadota bacterium]